MRRFVWMVTIATSLCATGTGVAQDGALSAATPAAHYSHTEIRQMIREARTPAQYQVLGSYFQQRQQEYQLQADSEKQEWNRRRQVAVGVALKYPSPADSARNLYQYYVYEADQAKALAFHYEGLAQQPESQANR